MNEPHARSAPPPETGTTAAGDGELQLLRMVTLRNPLKAAARLSDLLNTAGQLPAPDVVTADRALLLAEAWQRGGRTDEAIDACRNAANAAGALQPQDWPRVITALMVGADLAVCTSRRPHSNEAQVVMREHAESGLELASVPTVLGHGGSRGDQPTVSAARDLRGVDVYTTPADLHLLDAALRCMAGEMDVDIPAMIGWAVYAFRAARQLFGPTDPRTEAAADALAAVISRHGTHGPPVRFPAFASGGYEALIATRFSAVRALHERGLCDHAIREAQAALAQWTEHDSAPSSFTGIYLVATLRVLDLCGRVHAARALLDAYRPQLPGAGRRWNLLAAEFGTALLGDIPAIVGHRPICTGQPEPSDGPGPPRQRVYGEVRTLFLDYLSAIADTSASRRHRPAATTNTGPFTGASAAPSIGARPRPGPTRGDQSRPGTSQACRRRGG